MWKRHLPKSTSLLSLKTFNKPGKEAKLLHLIKDICKNPKGNILAKRVRCFPSKISLRMFCSCDATSH